MSVTHAPPIPALAAEILEFWFGDALEADWPDQSRHHIWFSGGKEVDQQIERRFGALVETALDDGFRDWEASPRSRMALILLLDQFTRNIYRGQARAFAGDARAQELVRDALWHGHEQELPRIARVFLYMPLMHAECLGKQDACVERFEYLHKHAPAAIKATLADNLHYAKLHQSIIAQFGRFPHRNAALGRESTEEELVFLKDGPRFGQ